MIHPGIDLGTTYSMIAHVNGYGQPTLFPDLHDSNQFRTPSVVYLGREGSLIGAPVEDLVEEGLDGEVARFMKAQLGLPDYRYTDHLGRDWSAPALSALILRKLARDARAFAGEDLGPAVVAVPAQFSDEQRRATLTAAELAGLSKVRLVEEPVAAAVYYGQEEGPADRTLLVYDFGGGTFDVTLLQVSADGLFVLASDGDSGLGGRLVDEAMMQSADEAFRRRHNQSSLADPQARERLRRACEDAKIRLSRGLMSEARRQLLLLDRPYEFVFTAARLKELAEPVIARSLQACERCLAAAGLQWQDVDKVMLTGGSSLLTGVAPALSQAWGRPTSDLIVKQPHQAVAFGAAVLADRFSRGPSEVTTLRTMTTSELALRVWDPESGCAKLNVLIARNQPLPARCLRPLHTAREDQSHIALEFVQHRGDPPETFELGRYIFGPIAEPRLHYPVELDVRCDADGLVQIAAQDPETQQVLQAVLQEGAAGTVDVEGQRRLVNSVEFTPY